MCGAWGLGEEHQWDGPSQGCVHPTATSPWLDSVGLRAVLPGLMSASFVTASVMSQAKKKTNALLWPVSLSRAQSSWKFPQRHGFSLGVPVPHEGN